MTGWPAQPATVPSAIRKRANFTDIGSAPSRFRGDLTTIVLWPEIIARLNVSASARGVMCTGIGVGIVRYRKTAASPSPPPAHRKQPSITPGSRLRGPAVGRRSPDRLRGGRQRGRGVARTGRPGRTRAIWISTMQGPVAPSMWKLTSVPSTLEPMATATAITSMRSKRSAEQIGDGAGRHQHGDHQDDADGLAARRRWSATAAPAARSAACAPAGRWRGRAADRSSRAAGRGAWRRTISSVPPPISGGLDQVART